MLVDENGKEIPETPETPAAPAAPATPSYVPADEFKTFQATVQGTLEVIKESLQAIRQPAAAAPHEDAPIEDASDEDIEAALAEGKGAKTFRKMVSAAVAQLDKKYDARAANLENTSGGALAGLASRTARGLMKHYDKPYIRKEVDALVASLPMKDRLNVESHITVYNAVLGAHMEEVVADEIEAKARAVNNTPGAIPGASSGRTNNAPVKPDVKTVFGEEAERELRSRGRSIDRVAQAFGFKDGDEYMKAAQDEGEGVVH